MRPAIALLVLSLTPVIASAQTTIQAGKWSAVVGTQGPLQILYDGEIIARNGQLVGFLPEWKGTRFTLGASELQTTPDSATWIKQAPGNQDATISLQLSPEGCRLSLNTTITQAGPSEFSLSLSHAALRTDEGRCSGWLNGSGFEAQLDGPAPFEKLLNIREIVFEQPHRSVTLRCEGFEIQDRRVSGGDLFLVQVIGSTGDAPRTVERSIALSVKDYPAEDVAGRTAFLSQRLIEYGDIEMDNPGFDADQPMAGWTANPNATVDTEQFHSAPASVRIRLTGQETDENPYVTRTVPITAGDMYQVETWIKTEDVTPAAKRGMSTTGATVILEFADKQGKWFASGDYATGVYKTRDWAKVATGAVRAPAGSGYAIIFLSLRANGTAWFDDVKLSSVKHHTVLSEPLPGATLDDNTPLFAWRTELHGDGLVQLCQDPAFPEGQVVETALSSTRSATLRRALKPGTWHWRVSIPSFDHVSHSFSFEQIAPEDRDCTEPLVSGEHGYVEDTTRSALVTITDDHDLSGGRFSATVNGEPADQSVGGVERLATGEYRVAMQVRPAGGWQEGLNRIDVTASDAAGNEGTGAIFRTWCEPMPKIEWTTHRGIKIGDEHRFLFGMYGILAEHLPTMQQAGFDFVHNYTWDGAGSVESAIAYLDAANAHGMKAFIGLDRRKLMACDEAFVAERVGALMAHPGLLCWYLFDEPDLLHQYVSPTWLERYYRLIKALDPFHPVVVTCAADNPVADYKESFDVHWTQVYGSTAHVAARLPKHRAMLKPDWPLAAILHSYDREQTGLVDSGAEFDPDRFQPDARVLRANAFMAITKGSSGLLWWWWGQGSERYMTISRAPREWQALQQVVADIRSIEPTLVADGVTEAWIEKPDDTGEVHFWEKKTADCTLLIAVNRDDRPCTVTTRPRLLPGNETLEVLFEGGAAQVTDGALTAAFEGLGVHVYRLDAN